MSVPKFCDIAKLLADFWDKHGCDQLYPHTCNIGAGTYHPATVFGVLGDDSRSFYYVQPSQRPQDGRYGQAGNRVYQHHQFQVVLKPFPDNAQQLAYQSLRAIGIDDTHDIRFVENNWESPVLGANGIGWEVWCDGMEILQYTYFQKMGGIELTTIPIEYAYGLERIALILANQSNIMDLQCSNTQYKDVHYHAEYYNSLHTFEHLDVSRTRDRFTSYLADCEHLLLHDNWYAAYEMLLQAVHQFNLLHGYGALGVAERADIILKLRTLTGKCCVAYQTCELSH